jgi:hypothetical protein
MTHFEVSNCGRWVNLNLNLNLNLFLLLLLLCATSAAQFGHVDEGHSPSGDLG